jgi:hypothetical protein
MTRTIFAVILLITLLSCQDTRPDKGKERIDNICDQFMQNFKDKRIPQALRLLKKNTVMAASTVDTLQATMTDHVNNVFPDYGAMFSYEFVSESKIKNFIAKRFYILKFEKSYLKVAFTLYNTAKGWAITGFKYDEELNELLD